MHQKIRRGITQVKSIKWSGDKIPNLLRKYRRVRGLKQKDVAWLLNLKSPSRLSMWEKGVCLPSLKNALRLFVVYKVMMVDAVFSDLVDSIREEIKQKEDEFFKRKSLPKG